ncbi:MAG: hypothetical protein ACE5NN_04580 [Candidatus Bathyarchaeia archaeon]
MAEDEGEEGKRAMDVRDRRAQYEYLDLLATTLTEHEKTLDKLIERLEKISRNLAQLGQVTELEEQVKPEVTAGKPEGLETLTYIKIKLNRPVKEFTQILESLKE